MSKWRISGQLEGKDYTSAEFDCSDEYAKNVLRSLEARRMPFDQAIRCLLPSNHFDYLDGLEILEISVKGKRVFKLGSRPLFVAEEI